MRFTEITHFYYLCKVQLCTISQLIPCNKLSTIMKLSLNTFWCYENNPRIMVHVSLSKQVHDGETKI